MEAWKRLRAICNPQQHTNHTYPNHTRFHASINSKTFRWTINRRITSSHTRLKGMLILCNKKNEAQKKPVAVVELFGENKRVACLILQFSKLLAIRNSRRQIAMEIDEAAERVKMSQPLHGAFRHHNFIDLCHFSLISPITP